MLAIGVGLQLDAVIEVEVAHAGSERHIHLAARDVVVVAVDDGPDRLLPERPAAGVRRRSCAWDRAAPTRG